MTTTGSFVQGAHLDLPGMSERNQDATVYVGNLDAKVDEEILWELFVQCGPIATVHLPRDRVTSAHQGFAFVEFKSQDDADYALRILNMIKLYGKPIRCNKSAVARQNQEAGANLFIGSLSTEIDERYLQDTFSAFGVITHVKIMRDVDTSQSKGFGFITFADFAAADAAIAAMSGQYLGNKVISVTYAHKKDKANEFHGTAAERLLADLKPGHPIGSAMPSPPPPPQNAMGGLPPGMPPVFFQPPPPPPPAMFMPPPPPPPRTR